MRADSGVFEILAYRAEVINFATVTCLTPLDSDIPPSHWSELARLLRRIRLQLCL